jgi:hypothetical protein
MVANQGTTEKSTAQTVTPNGARVSAKGHNPLYMISSCPKKCQKVSKKSVILTLLRDTNGEQWVAMSSVVSDVKPLGKPFYSQ